MEVKKNTLTNLENQRLIKKGKLIYKKIKSKLENNLKGKIIAIEVESEQYIIGDDEVEIATKIKNNFADKKFTFIRIGYPAVHKLRMGKNNDQG